MKHNKKTCVQKNICIHTSMYKDGQVIEENTEAVGLLRFLYMTRLGLVARFFFRRKLLSKILSCYQDSSLSKVKIKKFVKKHAIVLSDFIIPDKGFTSFNDFFVRKLKPGVRAIDQDPSVLVSPADGKILVIPEITQDTKFFVKSKRFCLETFLQNKLLAKKYERGTLLLFRLAPYDYHRYHVPCDALLGQVKKITGVLESVNPLVYKSGRLNPLLENERHYVCLQTKNFGTITMVSVGAMCVGRIVHTYTPEREHKKGDEMGYFAFGGSTLVLLFEPSFINIEQKFIEHSKENIETVVKMGERIAHTSVGHTRMGHTT